MGIHWKRLFSTHNLRTLIVSVTMVFFLYGAAPLLASNAQVWTSPPAGTTCAQLAAVDPTATNGQEWGRTILPGHNAPNGWFGVDVCGNGINSVTPGGANLSCDRVPKDLAKTGCAPGHATYDGYGLTFQCVELVARFSAWAYGDSPAAWLGNAPDLWTRGNHPSDFLAYPNGSARAPVPGDVLVWGTVDAHGLPLPDGPAGGHTAVVASVTSSHLVFVEENALSGQLNVPSETTSLSQINGRWIVGSSLVTHAGERALYGWLHSTKNTGRFTGAGAVRGSVPRQSPVASPTPSGADPTIVLPTLVSGVTVTPAGTLADLTWPNGTSTAYTTSAGLAAASPPRPVARSLGAPPAVSLAPDQVPAVVLSHDGSRDVYVRGEDGGVYDAHTTPLRLGITWRSLSAPPGAPLTGSIAATALPGGAAFAAVSTDGIVWWRAGPAANPGNWTAIGRPDATPLQGTVVLAGAPGSGLPIALGLGRDGRLYETQWVDASPDHPEWQPGWDGWTPLVLPVAMATDTLPLLPIFELPAGQEQTGQWSDVPLDVALHDASGVLWLLHLGPDQVWRFHPVPVSQPVTSILSGVAVQPPTAGAQVGAVRLHLYVASASSIALVSFGLDATGTVTNPHWESVTPQQPSSMAPSIGTAINLGPDLSALVTASDRSVQAVGTRPALALLAPQPAPTSSASTPSTSTAAGGAPALPILAGQVPAATTFSDDFSGSTLDQRWLPLDVPATPHIVSGTLSLASAVSPDRAELLQTAPSGDFTLTTRLVLPAGQQSSVRAGIMLYLDEADWLTLSVDHSGVASLCPIAWNQPIPCLSSIPLFGATTSHGLLLKLTRSGDTFTGLASANGDQWVAVGQWTPTLPASLAAQLPSSDSTSSAPNRASSRQPSAAPASPVMGPMPFACAGLFAQQTNSPSPSSSTRSWPSFLYFDVSVLSLPTP